MPRILKHLREMVDGERVRVYRNLNNGMLSVQDMTGRVIAHRHLVSLEDAEFVVRESGRQKVLREKRKNVHAFVVGKYAKGRYIPLGEGQGIAKYNPYKYSTFVCELGFPVHYSNSVVITSDGKIRTSAEKMR